MSHWTDMDALCEALRRTETREEAIRVVRFAPAPPRPFWGQNEGIAVVDIGVVDLPVAPANDPEVA